MPIPKPYKEILGDLSKATAEGRVNWTYSGGTVLVAMPDFSLTLWKGEDENSALPFVSVGLKEPGAREYLDIWFCEGNDSDLVFLQHLYDDAKRKAHNIEGKLKDLQNALKGGGAVGLPNPVQQDTAF